MKVFDLGKITTQILSKIKPTKQNCTHTWIETELGEQTLPRKLFLNGSHILKNPECSVCGEKKLKTTKEKKDYIKHLKKNYLI